LILTGLAFSHLCHLVLMETLKCGQVILKLGQFFSCLSYFAQREKFVKQIKMSS